MLKIIQYLHSNQNILQLLREGKISLLNVNTIESNLILESFDFRENTTKKDSYLLYWHA